MVNTNLLKAKIAENGMTSGRLAKTVGMSSNSMSRKINGKREFTLSECMRVCHALKVSDPSTIFFAENVPKTQQ